jgi:hypothetical protein
MCELQIRKAALPGTRTPQSQRYWLSVRRRKTQSISSLKPCLERRKDFTPLVYSVGMSACEAQSAERRLASALAWKWKRHCMEMCGFVHTRMTLAVVRANTLLLRGSRVPRSRPRPQIEDGATMEG